MRTTDFDMQLEKATSPAKAAKIVEETIHTIYPHYYPVRRGTVFSGSA